MKFRLLFFAAFLAFASCSSDDSSETVNLPVEHKDLKEITSYYANDVIAELRKFENNKLKKRYLYDSGEQVFEDLYTYNEDGLLIERHSTTTDGIEFNQSVNYDGQGRISEIENYDGHYEKYTFDYSQEGKIIETRISDGGAGVSQSQTVYELNNEGYITKVKSGALTIAEYDYQGDKVIKYKAMYYNDGVLEEDMTAEYNYSYDMNTEVKGEYINVWNNLFGNSKTNYILYRVPSRPIFTKNNYLSAYTYNGVTIVTTTMQYEFDANGFPVKQENFSDDGYYTKHIITYQ